MVTYEFGVPSWGECAIVFTVVEIILALVGYALTCTSLHMFFTGMYFTFSVLVGAGIIHFYKDFIDEASGRNAS